jgi:hypothetical protein
LGVLGTKDPRKKREGPLLASANQQKLTWRLGPELPEQLSWLLGELAARIAAAKLISHQFTPFPFFCLPRRQAAARNNLRRPASIAALFDALRLKCRSIRIS